jgi:hypothetical protein
MLELLAKTEPKAVAVVVPAFETMLSSPMAFGEIVGVLLIVTGAKRVKFV